MSDNDTLTVTHQNENGEHSITATAFGREYMPRENPIKFSLTVFTCVGILAALVAGLFLLAALATHLTTEYVSYVVGGLRLLFSIVAGTFVGLSIAGGIKYLITGRPEPFVHIKNEKTEDGRSFHLTFLSWGDSSDEGCPE